MPDQEFDVMREGGVVEEIREGRKEAKEWRTELKEWRGELKSCRESINAGGMGFTFGLLAGSLVAVVIFRLFTHKPE